MNHSKLFALIVGLLALFAGRSARADQARLLVCVQKCTEQMHVCITDQEPNLSVVCNGVAECNGLDQNDLKSFHDVCALCVKGTSENCPGGERKESTEPPVTDKVPPGVTAQPRIDTFESRCKSLGGEPTTAIDPNTQKPIKICLTLKGLHHRLSILEARMDQYKGTGQPVPPVLQDQARKDVEGTQRILKKIEGISGQLNEYENVVKQLGDKLLARLATEVRRLDDKNWEQDGRLNDLQKKIVVTSAPTVASQASLRPALTGLYIGPYYGRNLRDHYGVALHAFGVEMGLLPSLSGSGHWRLELNFGAGFGGFNTAKANGFSIGERLWEMHGHVGPRYTWDSGLALTGGLGLNRRSTFSHDDVSNTWIGAFLQPSYSLTGKAGHGLYILTRLGVGNTHYQHAIMDATGNKLDYEFNLGLGYAFMP